MTQWTESSIKDRPVAVLGGGVLGRRIACTWAAGGYNVIIRDPDASQRNAALQYLHQNIDIYPKITNSKPGKVEAVEDLEAAVKDAWQVIEAIPEKLELKIDTFGELERLTKGDCLLCSNSSSYKSSEMVSKVGTEGRKRVLNMHYTMPPDNRIVELMTDGETDEAIFPFLMERLKAVGMKPILARKESTGFVFNRLWASIKREYLMILAEGVSTPEELDAVWVDVFGNSKYGPGQMMDAVGLDTVAFIEEHYIKERGLSGEKTVDFLKKNYLEKGKLGAKSGKGGLYPPGATVKVKGENAGTVDNIHAPILYFLDIGLLKPGDPLHSGRILSGAVDGRPLKTLVSGEVLPDGLDISLKTGRIYWTCMGVPPMNDGCIRSCKIDGSDINTIIKSGQVHTPKQLVIQQETDTIYFCDREDLRVMRCKLDGSNHETLVQTGEWQNPDDQADQTKWCVGISVSEGEKKFYWTQKGGSKAGHGRIFRANLEMPKGMNAKNRDDIECVLEHLPEPIDLEIDHHDGFLYWTDRGDPPVGNTLNRITLSDLGSSRKGENPRYVILARNLHEAIGLKLDLRNKHIYTTDLGGAVYRFDMDGGNRKKLYEDEGSFSGIGLVHV